MSTKLKHREVAARLVELVRHGAVAPHGYTPTSDHLVPGVELKIEWDFEKQICKTPTALNIQTASGRDIDAFLALIKEIQRCNAFALAVLLTKECWTREKGGGQ
jgi:hypothetical protein